MKHQVLIVEDDSQSLDMLYKVLSRKFPQVEFQLAPTQEKAGNLIQTAIASGRRFDMVILDFKLPVSEGCLPEGSQGVFRQLRDNMADAVIVHITAFERDEDFMKHILTDVMRSQLGPRSVFVSKLNVRYIHDLVSIMEKALNKRFLSCFISYSHRDEKFVEELYFRLKLEGIEVWFAPARMKPGYKLHEEIAGAVQTYDKLLLVISEASMRSDWVATELRIAISQERQTGNRKFIRCGLWTSGEFRNGNVLTPTWEKIWQSNCVNTLYPTLVTGRIKTGLKRHAFP